MITHPNINALGFIVNRVGRIGLAKPYGRRWEARRIRGASDLPATREPMRGILM